MDERIQMILVLANARMLLVHGHDMGVSTEQSSAEAMREWRDQDFDLELKYQEKSFEKAKTGS